MDDTYYTCGQCNIGHSLLSQENKFVLAVYFFLLEIGNQAIGYVARRKKGSIPSVNRPAGLADRGHGRCIGGLGVYPHTSYPVGKCCWPEHRRPHPPHSFFPKILQTAKASNDGKDKKKWRWSIHESNKRVLSGSVFCFCLFHNFMAWAFNRLFASTAETHFSVRSCSRWSTYKQERA